jgi:hypothetical protein
MLQALLEAPGVGRRGQEVGRLIVPIASLRLGPARLLIDLGSLDVIEGAAGLGEHLVQHLGQLVTLRHGIQPTPRSGASVSSSKERPTAAQVLAHRGEGAFVARARVSACRLQPGRPTSGEVKRRLPG